MLRGLAHSGEVTVVAARGFVVAVGSDAGSGVVCGSQWQLALWTAAVCFPGRAPSLCVDPQALHWAASAPGRTAKRCGMPVACRLLFAASDQGRSVPSLLDLVPRSHSCSSCSGAGWGLRFCRTSGTRSITAPSTLPANSFHRCARRICFGSSLGATASPFSSCPW